MITHCSTSRFGALTIIILFFAATKVSADLWPQAGQITQCTTNASNTEWNVSNCQFNEAIASVMAVFYWPVINTDGSNVWQQLVNKVKMTNLTSRGIVNGVIGLDCVNGGAVAK